MIVIERLSAMQFNNENENPDATWSPPTDKAAPAVGAKRKSGSWRECEDVQELRNNIEKQEQLLAKRDLKCKNLQQARRLFSRGMAMHAFFTGSDLTAVSSVTQHATAIGQGRSRSWNCRRSRISTCS